MRSRISGVTASSFSGEACNPACLRNGSISWLSSSVGNARKCSALSQIALGSKGSASVKFTTALARLIFSSVNASRISTTGINSRSFFGDHPSRQRKLIKACGRNPASRYVVTLTTGPCLRFESFAPSGATSSGKCANCGAAKPMPSKISRCLKVFVKWSCPRIMWLISRSASSTHEAR